MRILLSLIFTFGVLAKVGQASIEQFEGNYEKYSSYLTNGAKDCPSNLTAFYWEDSGFLDFQMYDGKVENFVDIPPLQRDYLKNSHAIEVAGEYRTISEDRRFMTTTYMKADNLLSEMTVKKTGIWPFRKYRAFFAVNISVQEESDLFGPKRVVIEEVVKGRILRKCKYLEQE